MKLKKRKKQTRMRGSHTHSRGFKKKARGKGHRGGIGKAGSGKRADHKKVLIQKGKRYFGRDKVRRALMKKEIRMINLEKATENLDSLIKRGVARKNNENYEIDFSKFKVIGRPELKLKLKIKAMSASKGAVEAVKKAGGEIVILRVSENKKNRISNS